MMAKKTKENGIGSCMYENFEDRDKAQSRVKELEKEGYTIHMGRYHPLMRKWVIAYT